MDNILNNNVCPGIVNKLNVQGVIFDMDGVLFDTEKLYERFWCEAAQKLGYNMTVDDVVQIRSTDAVIACRILKERLGEEFDYEGVKKLRVALMHEYTEKMGVELKPGVIKLLKYLKLNNYKIALATTSNQARARNYLSKGNIIQYFDYILSGDLVMNSKPDPEIYLTAAKGIGLESAQCIAVEDSYNGVRSAYQAGCKVIMVPDRDEPDNEMHNKTFMILNSIDKIIDILES